MKLSKSKLALAKVINENGGWVEGAMWAAQDIRIAFFDGGKPECRVENRYWYSNGSDGNCLGSIASNSDVKNRHQCVLSREEYYQAYPVADADGWIEWSGGGCPVDFGDEVDVMLRLSVGGVQCKAGDVHWCHLDIDSDIIAYRLHKPEVKPEPCESVMRSIPDPELDDAGSRWAKALELVKASAPHLLNDKYKFNGDEVMGGRKPTIEQLAQEYRNAKDYAERLQKDANEACAKADSILCKIELAGEEIGFIMNPIKGD